MCVGGKHVISWMAKLILLMMLIVVRFVYTVTQKQFPGCSFSDNVWLHSRRGVFGYAVCWCEWLTGSADVVREDMKKRCSLKLADITLFKH